MIDVLTGTVSFDSWKLGPATEEASFLALTASHPQRTLRSIGIYTHHGLRGVLLAKTRFNATFTFKEGRIERISFSLPSAGASWDDWTEAEEQQRKRDHDDWLKAQLGDGPYDYSWGVVSSNFLPQSGFSTITLSYLGSD